MQLRHIVVAIAILGSSLPAAAQSTLARISNIASRPVRSNEAADRRTFGRTPLGSPALPARDRSPFIPLASPIANGYTHEHNLEILPKFEETQTLFMSHSSVLLAAFAGGHVRLAGFGSTLVMGNVELGPSGAAGLLDFHPWRHYQPGDPRSVGSYGVSLGLHLGRESQAGNPFGIWRCVTRLIAETR
jgi:hypothetical protein